MPRIVALWTSPRSVSTAIYKSFDQRDDTTCSYEPYNDCFYFSSERLSSKYGDREERLRYDGQAVFDSLIAQSEGTPVLFVKDMAFMANPYITDAQLSQLSNGFIIRSPEKCIQSILRVKPDFDRQDFGYGSLREMFHRLKDTLGLETVVVDGDSVTAEPEKQLRELCNRLDLAFDEKMLTWPEGHVRPWEPYELTSHERWHSSLIRTTGFEERPRLEKLPITAEQQAILDEAQEIYASLKLHAI